MVVLNDGIAEVAGDPGYRFTCGKLKSTAKFFPKSADKNNKFQKFTQTVIFNAIINRRSPAAVRTLVNLANIVIIAAITCACKDQTSQSQLQQADCDSSTITGLQQQMDKMVAKTDQSDFLKVYQDDAAKPTDPASLKRNLDTFASTLDQCSKKGAFLAGETVSAPTCGLSVVARAIVDNTAYGLQKVLFAPFHNTLKFKRINGEGRLLVKRRATGLVTDPRQDYIIEGYQNAYHWAFRKGAGDLHPAFLTADELATKPWAISDAISLGRLRAAANPTTKALFDKYQKIVNFLEQSGYLLADLPKGVTTKRSDFDYMQIVDDSRIADLDRDTAVRNAVAETFGNSKSAEVLARIKRLMQERVNPPIQNREITSAALQALNIEVPFVTLVAENGQFYVQLLDHHRIYGAQGLAMSIEVHHMWGINSFN